jgi:hypothetical protein
VKEPRSAGGEKVSTFRENTTGFVQTFFAPASLRRTACG